jgi:hypothetical protein
MAPKRELDFHPQLLAKTETHLDVALMATSQENRLAEAIQSVSEQAMRLAPAMWRQQPVMLEENSLVEVIQPVSEWVMRWALAM